MIYKKEIPTTNYEDFFQRAYFLKIINNIIKIGNLRTEKKILDYGCGEKMLEKILGKKIYNYDIKPQYSEIKNIKNLKYDSIVLNHVLMYMKSEEIKKLFKIIKKTNPRCKVILGLGKHNLLSKIGKIITGNFNAHINIKATYSTQIKIFLDYCAIIKIKKNIFFMTDIYYGKIK